MSHLTSAISILREVTIDFASIEYTNESDGIAVNNQTNTEIAQSDPEIGTFRLQFFQVVNNGYAVGGFDFQNDFLYAGQELFVSGVFL